MPTWLLVSVLVLLGVLLVLFWFGQGWFERHPWPGSRRHEIEEQIRRNNRSIEHERHKKPRT